MPSSILAYLGIAQYILLATAQRIAEDSYGESRVSILDVGIYAKNKRLSWTIV